MDDHKSVLIVDDDPEIRHVLRMLFEWEAFDVVGEATDGGEGVTMAVACQPDFVLLDVMMPSVAGDEAAQMIRGFCPDTCIVAFSSLLRTCPAWADAYLNKERIADVVPALAALMEGMAERGPVTVPIADGP